MGNRSAERIREILRSSGAPYGATTGMDNALANERRAVLTRIRSEIEAIERVEAISPLVYVVRPNGSAISRAKVVAILDVLDAENEQ